DFVVALLAVARIGALAVPLSTFLRGPELRRGIRHADVDTLVAPRVLLGRDLQDGFEEVLPGLRDATDPQLFLPSVPYLRRIWVTGPADRPWATAPPDLDAFREDDSIGAGLVAELESEVAPSDRMVVVQTSGAT